MALTTIFTGLFTSVVGASFAATVVGTFLIDVVATAATSLIKNAILGGNKKSPSIGISGTTQTGGEVPRSFVIGTTLAEASLVYQNQWGSYGKTPNAYVTYVLALSDLPGSQLASWMVNGEIMALDAVPHAEMGYPALKYRVDGTDHAWVKYFDGTQTEADPFLVDKVSSVARPYQSTRIGTGVCYAVVTFLRRADLFSGFPRCKFALTSTPFYDVSRDSTQGGDGPHRFDDMTTWGGSGDSSPMVQAYNVLRGIRYDTRWLYGLQKSGTGNVPSSEWIAAINKCKSKVLGPTGLVDRFRCAGVVRVSTDMASALEGIVSSCAGRIAEVGGVYYPHVAEPEASVASFSDGDIVDSFEEGFVPFVRMAEMMNGVTATYPEPEESYTVRPAPVLHNADLEEQDGGFRRVLNLSFPMVPWLDQVQRLQKEILHASRRGNYHTIVLPPKFRKFRPNETLTWTQSDEFGYVNKTFQIDGRVPLPEGGVMLELREADASDHAWDHATEFKPITFRPIINERPTNQILDGFDVEKHELLKSDGSAAKSVIRCSWSVAELDDVAGINIVVETGNGSALVTQKTVGDVMRGWDVVEAGIQPGVSYRVRARIVPDTPRGVDWTGWAPVTTDDIRPTVADLASGVGVNMLRNTDFVSGAEGWEFDYLGSGAPGATDGIIAAGNSWASHSGATLFARQSGTDQSYVVEIKQRPAISIDGGLASGFPIAPGDTVEVSANLSAHRCYADVAIDWFDAAGDSLGRSAFSAAHSAAGAATEPASWGRVGVIETAPAGAAFAAPVFRRGATRPEYGWVDSWLFIYQPMMAITHTGAQEFAPYNVGTSPIVSRDRIADGAISEMIEFINSDPDDITVDVNGDGYAAQGGIVLGGDWGSFYGLVGPVIRGYVPSATLNQLDGQLVWRLEYDNDVVASGSYQLTSDEFNIQVGSIRASDVSVSNYTLHVRVYGASGDVVLDQLGMHVIPIKK